MFPVLGGTHNRLAIHTTSIWKLSNAKFKELVTGSAKASVKSVVGNIAGVGLLLLEQPFYLIYLKMVLI